MKSSVKCVGYFNKLVPKPVQLLKKLPFTMCLRGGVRKMFDFAKTFASILSVGLDWLMFNLAPIKFQ